MTAQTQALPPTLTGARGGLFLGFGTVLRKEIAEWIRGRRALIVAAVSVPLAVLSTIIPFLVPKDSPGAEVLSMDPTVNILMGWAGLTFQLVAVLATMSLLSTERDRGTLGWNLTNPVSPTSILAAKWCAAMLVYAVAGVILPLTISVAVAALIYPSAPDLGTIGLFAVLYLMVPAFWIGLTVALGTGVKATAGIAGIAILVMFLPSGFAALLPIINDLSPTSIGTWAIATATGQPASILTFGAWLVAMAALAVGSKLVFDRQEF